MNKVTYGGICTKCHERKTVNEKGYCFLCWTGYYYDDSGKRVYVNPASRDDSKVIE